MKIVEWDKPVEETLRILNRIKDQHSTWMGLSTSAIRDIFRKFLLEHTDYTAKEIPVPDRGDGHGGRVDLFFTIGDKHCAIEFDKITPKKKTVFKLRSFGPMVHKIIVLKYGVFRDFKRFIGDDIHIISMDIRKDRSMNQMGLSKEARQKVTKRRWDIEAEYLRANAEQEMVEIRKCRDAATTHSAYRSKPRFARFRRLMIALANNHCAKCHEVYSCGNLSIAFVNRRFYGQEEIRHCEVLCKSCYNENTISK